MFRSEKLYLHEKIMLLALRDKEGTVNFGVNYSFAIGGAILAELLLSKHIETVINGELAGKAAKEAMQAAIMVAAIMPVIVTTTVST